MDIFQDENEAVRIIVTRKTREELKELGIKGESYEKIIRRLMKGWISGGHTTGGIKIHNLKQYGDGELVGPKGHKEKREKV